MMRRFLEPLLATAHTFVFAMLPMLLVLTSFGGPFPTGVETARALALPVIAVIVVLGAMRLFGGSLAARAAMLSATIIVLSGYRTFIELVAPAAGARLIEQPLVALAFAFLAIGIGVAVRRPWDRSHRHTASLSGLALVMVAVGAVPSAWSVIRPSPNRWRATADRLIDGALSSLEPTTPQRDVYVIVLDGLGRADVLRGLYGVDTGPFELYLRANGFHVSDRARAPYSQTELSISALLNMDYLDEVASAAGRGNVDRSPAEYMLSRNAMMAAARRAGYDVVSVGSEFAPTRAFRDARELLDPPRGIPELQQEAMKMTPLAALPLQRWTIGAHRANVLRQLDALEALAPNATGPHRLVFAHILAPHPPFVFNADGSARPLDTNWLEMGDGSYYGGTAESYVQGYHAQVRFTMARIEAVVRTILRAPGPTPAILITGDHGPGSQLRWDNQQASNMTERMGVFAAYRFPGVAPTAFTPTVSPVSAARLLTNAYFGTSLPSLPDQSALSVWSRPCDFRPLPSEGAAT